MLSRLSWDVGSRRALTPPRANRETGVSAPGGERPCRSLLSSPSSSTTPRTSRASPVGAARPPSDRAISFEAVFAASRARVVSPSHARHPPLTSPLGLPATRRVQPNPDTQRKQTELWKSLILGCVESARRRMAFFTRTTRPFGPRVFTNHCAASLTFSFSSRVSRSSLARAGGAITTALSPSAWTTTRTLCGATS